MNKPVHVKPADMAHLEADFTTELSPGSIKGAMKQVDAGSRDLWMVDPTALRVMENFNPRVKNKSYAAHVRYLADSMKAEGYYQDSALAGYPAVVDGETVIYIYSGHSRLLAVALANSEGAEIVAVPVSVNIKGLSMDDMNVGLIRGNSGKTLAPYEAGIVCKRLFKSGHTEAEVARRTGFTIEWIDQLLKLMAAPMKLKEMVANEVVTATLAIEMINAHGPKALEKLQEAVDAASAKGRGSITKKDMPGASFNSAVKRSAPSMYATLTTIQGDPGYAGLSPTVREALDQLMIELAKKKAPDEAGATASVDPRQNKLFVEPPHAAA